MSTKEKFILPGDVLITQERNRQAAQEGYYLSHDQEHDQGELVAAAIAYAGESFPHSGLDVYWPWDVKGWKPSEDRVRNLVKAGALIAAEIDRIQNYERFH